MDDFNSRRPGKQPVSPTSSQALPLCDDMVSVGKSALLPYDECIAAIEDILEWDPFVDEVLGANPLKSDATDLKVHGDDLDFANESAVPSCYEEKNQVGSSSQGVGGHDHHAQQIELHPRPFPPLPTDCESCGQLRQIIHCCGMT